MNEKESNVLNPVLNQHMQLFLDSIKCQTDFSPDVLQNTIDTLLNVFQSTHWMRKLTTGTVLQYLLKQFPDSMKTHNNKILQVVVLELKSDKRETRDIAAQVVASLNEDTFRDFTSHIIMKETDQYEYREALAMVIGHRLKNSQDQSLILLIEQNLGFQCNPEINKNYVHWYCQKAALRSALQGNKSLRLLRIASKSFCVSELKVRKTAADVAGLILSGSSEGFLELWNILSELSKTDYTKLTTEQSYEVHAKLLSLTVAVQVLTGTHVSFKSQPYQLQQEEHSRLVAALENLYVQLPFAFNGVKAMDGLFKSALIQATLPGASVIKDLLNRPELMALDGAIAASCYMQRFFRQSNASYKLQLQMLCFYSSKAVSVLAMRALYHQTLFAGGEIDINIFDFKDTDQQDVVYLLNQKLSCNNAELKIAAFKMTVKYSQQSVLAAETVKIIADLCVKSLSDKASNVQSAAAELLSQIANQLQAEDVAGINEAAIPLFVQRMDCAGQLSKYFVVTGNKEMSNLVLIYAFDAVNLQLAEQCRQVAPVAAKLFDCQALMDVINLIKDDEILVLNGIPRLMFGLKYQCGKDISKQMIQLAADVQEQAGEDFFEELNKVYSAYLAILSGKQSEPAKVLAIDRKQEFDPHPENTAALLVKKWAEKKQLDGCLEEIILSVNKTLSQNTSYIVQQLIYDSTVQVEQKLLLLTSLLGTQMMLPPPASFDVRKNEVFDFNSINK